MKTIETFGARYAIRPIQRKESDIITPNLYQKKLSAGIVLSCGDCESDEIKTGDAVLFDPFSGLKFSVDSDGERTDVLIVKYDSILAVVSDAEAVNEVETVVNAKSRTPLL